MKFRSKQELRADAEVRVNVSEETRELLATFNGDLAAVREMLTDLSATAAVILDTIEHEIAVEVNKVVERAEAVVEQKPPRPEPVKKQNGQARSGLPETPFTRAPRTEQIAWLLELLADGEWHNSTKIAKDHASDERHARYMKRIVGYKLREMYEEGLLDRQPSEAANTMFDYRLQ
jgi:hypothetical protein